MEENQTNQQSYIARASGLKSKDYIAYAAGDVGCCLVFGLVTSLLQTYYTDVLFMNPLFIMLMFVLARVWDAINDPIMGRICDTVKTSKWGRYRPWFLYGGIPLAIAAILMFVKWPGLGDAANKGDWVTALYAAITYIAFGMCYTLVQIPYGSLASVVTLDEKERSKLSTFRSVGAALGTLPVMILSMVAIQTKTNTTTNLRETVVNYPILFVGVIVMAILSLGMMVFAFLGNKERVATAPAKPEKGASIAAVKRIFSSRAMMAVSIAAMLLLAGQMFTQSFYVYLIRQYFGRGGIFVTLPTILTYIPMAVLMLFVGKMNRKFGKKELCALGMAVAAIANLAMFPLLFINKDVAFWLFMLLCLVSGFGLNFFVLQVWSMASDAIDEIEVKTGVREDGTAYSFFMFFRKLGQVISAVAVNGALLAMNYFDSADSAGNFTFTAEQLNSMFILATVIPAVTFGIMALILFVWYPLSKKKLADLQVLKEEHLAAAAAKEEAAAE